jgi:hypothetical protein
MCLGVCTPCAGRAERVVDLLAELGRRDTAGVVVRGAAVFEVVAESPDQALGYPRDLEPPRAAASLVVHAADRVQPADGALHGVCSASGRVFFPREQRAS